MSELDLNIDKLDDAVLAILSLSVYDGNRVWKGLDRAIIDRLYAKGLIADPVGKAKSLILTEDGLARAEVVLRTIEQQLVKLRIEREVGRIIVVPARLSHGGYTFGQLSCSA